MEELGRADAVLPDLIETVAFRRLKGVRFLGGIDYVLRPGPNGAPRNRRYTRFQHSIGVARLASAYARLTELPSSEGRVACVAALLHDLGHPPLSHSLEPVFKEVFDLEHHQATAELILGRLPLGHDLAKVLRSHGVSAERVVAVVSGEEAGFHDFFAGPINFDTIEGILRSRSYMSHGPTGLSPESVVESAALRRNNRDRETVDSFWSYKSEAYSSVINSSSGVLADHVCQLFMRRNINSLTGDDYFATEQRIFRKLPGLRELLTSHTFVNDVKRELVGPIKYSRRLFFVDKSGDFFKRQDRIRYRHDRESRVLNVDGQQEAKGGPSVVNGQAGFRNVKSLFRQ